MADKVAFEAKVQGVVTDPAEAIRASGNADGQVVYQWTDSGRAAPSGDRLLEQVETVHALFRTEYAGCGDAKRARAAVRATAAGRAFASEYRRFFDLVTDAATVEIPERMPLIREMVRVTDAMHRGVITQEQCRVAVLAIAKRDMDIRNRRAQEKGVTRG